VQNGKAAPEGAARLDIAIRPSESANDDASAMTVNTVLVELRDPGASGRSVLLVSDHKFLRR
jgi:hypothetical protein